MVIRRNNTNGNVFDPELIVSRLLTLNDLQKSGNAKSGKWLREITKDCCSMAIDYMNSGWTRTTGQDKKKRKTTQLSSSLSSLCYYNHVILTQLRTIEQLPSIDQRHLLTSFFVRYLPLSLSCTLPHTRRGCYKNNISSFEHSMIAQIPARGHCRVSLTLLIFWGQRERDYR